MTGTRQLSRASSTNKKTCEASRNLSSDGISTEGKCAGKLRYLCFATHSLDVTYGGFSLRIPVDTRPD
eukprot:153176-Rhodomonas_salina.2